jgi:hypothetical protein
MRLIKYLALAIIVTTTSCKKDSISTDNFYVGFKATLNGTSEIPSNGSAATGTATATYNSRSKILIINIPYQGLTATSAHIHKGAAGSAGTATVFTITNLASPITFTSTPLTAAQEADLMANLYYIDIHSAAYPNGEIRGQLIML